MLNYKPLRWLLLLLLVATCGCKKDAAGDTDYKEGVWYEHVFYVAAVDLESKLIDITSLDDKNISFQVSFYDSIVPEELINSDFDKRAESDTYLIASARFRLRADKTLDSFILNGGWTWTVLPNGLPS